MSSAAHHIDSKLKQLGLVTLLWWGLSAQAMAGAPPISLPSLPSANQVGDKAVAAAADAKDALNINLPPMPTVNVEVTTQAVNNAMPALPTLPATNAPAAPAAAPMPGLPPVELPGAAAAPAVPTVPAVEVTAPKIVATGTEMPELPGLPAPASAAAPTDGDLPPLPIPGAPPAVPTVVGDLPPLPLPPGAPPLPGALPVPGATGLTVAPPRDRKPTNFGARAAGVAAFDKAIADAQAEPKKKTWQTKLAPQVIPPKTDFNYKRHLLPMQISRTQYTKENAHLPRRVMRSDYEALLFSNINKGDLNAMRALLNAGTSINATNEYGETPLEFARRIGAEPAAKLLLARGAI